MDRQEQRDREKMFLFFFILEACFFYICRNSDQYIQDKKQKQIHDSGCRSAMMRLSNCLLWIDDVSSDHSTTANWN